MIDQNELAALKEAALRASQDAMDAHQAVSQAERALQNLKLKLQAAQARARNVSRDYQTAVQRFHIQQQTVRS